MATLEKIRSRSVLLLIIVGAALLAFIIGDFFTSGRTLFGTGTTIAKVGDVKVDVQEFQRRAQQAAQQAQNNGQRPDNAQLNQQVLDQMIAEKLFYKEAEKLGLTVTDSELTEAMVGRNSAYVNRYVQQNFGLPDAVTAHDMAFNPGKYGIPADQAAYLQQAWVELEKNIEQSLLMQKFNNLFSGVLQANDLDTKALYDENASTATVVYALKALSSLPDNEYEPTDADIAAIYNSEKGLYAIDAPEKVVSYIAVNITPSPEDNVAGQKKVEEALAALNADAAAASLPDQPDFIVERKKLTASQLDREPRMRAALDTLSVGRAVLVSKIGNEYTLAKLLGKSSEVDKVKIDFLQVQGTKAQTDSLIAVLQGGVAIDSLSSPLVAGSQKNFELSLLDPQYAQVAEILATRPEGVYFTPDTVGEAYRIFRVAERTAPVTVYDVAEATYTVEPSNATVNTLEANLQNYVASHKTAREFADSAATAGYMALTATVNPSSSAIGNVPDSHAAVAWAVEAKKGDVSPVFGDVQTGRLVALAVTEAYDKYVPVTDPGLNAQLAMRARNNKKAEKLLADYAGKAKDVPGYAQVMGVEVDTTTVTFGQYLVPGIGVQESALLGAVAAAKQGDFIGPIQTNNGVVVLQVTEIDTEGRPYVAEENAVRYNQQRGATRLGNNLPAILIGKNKVNNKMTTFYK